MAARPHAEARSLSSINYLAANPPQYPYHPELRESLTLYISRVPGTQDVILSTFRPLRKNVTAEDVANSLYYVHLDTAEDELLAASQQPKRAVSPRSSSESSRSTIPRKPLPSSTAVPRPEGNVVNSSPPRASPPAGIPTSTSSGPNPDSLAPPPTLETTGVGDAVAGYRQNPMFQKRQSAGPLDVPDPSRPSAPSTSPSIRRKALHSMSPTALGHGRELSTTSSVSDPRTAGPPLTPTKSGPLPARPVPTMSPAPLLHPPRITSPGRSDKRPSSVSFSLSIIRRDPTTGTQCNVGKILSFQTNVPTPHAAAPNLDPDNMGDASTFSQHITIRLETSGYAKYRDLPSRADIGRLRPLSGHSFTQQVSQGGVGGPAEDVSPALKPAWRPVVEEGFTRQVVMSYGTNWTENLKKAFQRKKRLDNPAHGGSASPEDTAAQPFSHTRQGSASTVGSVESTDGRHSPTLVTHPGPGLKPKGYVFMSPWNGRCEFRTNANGRGIRCRHILDPANVKLDPREVAQSIRDAQAIGRSRGDEISSALVGAKPVSELRFNLPQSGHRQGPEQDGRPKSSRWSASHMPGAFSKLLHQGAKSSEDEYDSADDEHDDYDRDMAMDATSLGKEHAGGGIRGRRAKLGKLIIHDEGLKMLDLVVAANIGVWWTTWGRKL